MSLFFNTQIGYVFPDDPDGISGNIAQICLIKAAGNGLQGNGSAAGKQIKDDSSIKIRP